MQSVMATNIPKNVTAKLGEITDFQLHKSQLNFPKALRDLLIDFTEKKLRAKLKECEDPQQKKSIENLLKSYLVGDVAVAWKRGQPVWINVTKA